MKKFNKAEFMKLASKNGLTLKDEPVRMTETQRIYDFDIVKGSKIKRFVIVSDKFGRYNVDSANVYYGESSKGGINFNTYIGLIKQLKEFK